MAEANNFDVQFESVYEFLIDKLQQLPEHLSYHNVKHTRAVLDSTIQLAELEQIGEEETMLLKTAALFHDAGFLRSSPPFHEEASCKIVKESLPGFGYSQSQIQKICEIIMVTKLPQTPANKLESIMCDADLHYLGTHHFFTITENLYHELKHHGMVKHHKEWNDKQKAFIKDHHFFTTSAQELYEDVKQENFKTLSKQSTDYTENSRIRALQDFFLIIVGVIIAGFALKGFLVPNNFLDGGVTGLSLLLHEVYHINLSSLVLVLNLPLIIAGYYSINKHYALKTLSAVILLAVCLLVIPYPLVTSDKLLISIFGGMFLGLGTGLTMRAGCALDGMEVLALYTLKRTSFTITEIILGFNIVIFSVAAIKFGLETALYSVLTYLAATRMIDYVVEGIQAYTGVTIVSANSESIKHKLVDELRRGITVYKGERGFLPGKFEVSSECDIIFTVVTRLELRRLKNLVYESDPKAFVFAYTIKEASGGIIKQRLHH